MSQSEIDDFNSSQACFLNYRRAYFEVYGLIPSKYSPPSTKAWPEPFSGKPYRDKLVGHLNLNGGSGIEIGPLNLPLLSKQETNVLYVDHLDTEGIQKKYSFLSDLTEVDRPIIDDNLAVTLRRDAPLDYAVASQVMEHVPNPIRWMREIAEVLGKNGRLSISLPDRRMTFDLYREETRASDMIAAFINNATTPDVRAVYDHHSQAAAVNMQWALSDSLTPQDILSAGGSVTARVVTTYHMSLTEQAKSGKYLDVHCWVFTPISFLLAMAHIAGEGLLPYKLHQFYPTELNAPDRSNHSFVTILEKSYLPAADLRKSILMDIA